MGLKDRIYYKALNYVKGYDLKDLFDKPAPDFNSTYELAEMSKIISFYFPEVDLLIDIGAHKGKFTNAFTSLIKTKRVIGVEPNASLHAEIKKNNPNINLELFSCGLAEKEGKSEYYEHEDPSMNSIVESDKKVLEEKFPYDNPALLKKKEIDILTLDILMERHQTSVKDERIFLKIDTQGSELNILKGAIKTLTKVKGCIAEQMFVNAYKSDYEFNDLLTFMTQNGFQLMGAVSITKRQTFELSSADFLFIKK